MMVGTPFAFRSSFRLRPCAHAAQHHSMHTCELVSRETWACPSIGTSDNESLDCRHVNHPRLTEELLVPSALIGQQQKRYQLTQNPARYIGVMKNENILERRHLAFNVQGQCRNGMQAWSIHGCILNLASTLTSPCMIYKLCCCAPDSWYSTAYNEDNKRELDYSRFNEYFLCRCSPPLPRVINPRVFKFHSRSEEKQIIQKKTWSLFQLRGGNILVGLTRRALSPLPCA